MLNSMVFKVILFSVIVSFSNAVNARQHWEYLAKTYPLMGNDQALTQTLNQLGKQQWELVNCTEGDAQLTCLFKRIAQGS